MMGTIILPFRINLVVRTSVYTCTCTCICNVTCSEMSMERGESPNDMVFEGGLRIPGSIWNRLYR